jgi:transposase
MPGMANQLKMADRLAIQGLLARGWSHRRIARELVVHRETVARYARLTDDGPKPAKAPTGSDPPEGAGNGVESGSDRDAKPANVPAGSGRSSCEPHRQLILEMLEAGLSAQRIYQDLRTEHGIELSYYAVRRFVRRLRSSSPMPYRRIEVGPGQEAQIDFGRGAPVIGPDDRRRGTWFFRIVLSHSRKGYTEVVHRQTTESLIQCLENAFHAFSGVPQTLVFDNAKNAVLHADWYDPDLHPKITAFCQHYGTVLLPTRPYTPRHKGKIERGVGYVKDNALKGRRFESLQSQNEHLRRWERTVADTRIHGTTRRQVARVFEQAERPALAPLPTERFPFFHEARRRVHRDGHVEVDKAYYSVPPEYVGHDLWARWDARLVRLFNDRLEQIVVHPKQAPGKFSTRDQHILPAKRSCVERGTEWMLQRAGRVGPQTGQWARAMLEHRGIAGVRALQGLLSLTTKHADHAIEHACEVAHGHGAYRLKFIRAVINRGGATQGQLEFTQEHTIIRSLNDYDRFVRDAFTKGGTP